MQELFVHFALSQLTDRGISSWGFCSLRICCLCPNAWIPAWPKKMRSQIAQKSKLQN